jgi:very-short-patch-repair endonuclease
MGADRTIARLASRQDGIVTRRQLLDAGVTRDEIKHRLGSTQLIAIHWGVYAAGYAAISNRARVRAGLLAAGPTGAGSRSSATYLYDLTPTLPDQVEITITSGHRRQRPGLVVHRAQTLETTYRHGLRVTTVLQTLEDLRWDDTLVREALARQLIRPEQLPGPVEDVPTRSALENRMRRLCRAAGLPLPVPQFPIGRYVIDFAWPEHRVLVETDDWGTHGRRAAFEDDRARDADLVSQGWVILRFTWRQLTETPHLVTARLAAALALNASTPGTPRGGGEDVTGAGGGGAVATRRC